MNFQRICSLSDLEDGVAYRFDVDGVPVAVVRLDEKVHAIGDTCSHADVSLSEGEVDTDACALECWKHGSLFSLETGEALSLPAIKPVKVYELVVDDNNVMVAQ
tara:strand:- start:367 stop:678 length:312 start_codon:yes stop_codon:yes gene_type:complete